MTANALLDLSSEAASALSQGKAIVALESTIITHGMPYPRNLETALMLEETVRAGGATPATIAVIEGRFKVGLARAALEDLSRLSGGVVKASRRDLAAVVARHAGYGGTIRWDTTKPNGQPRRKLDTSRARERFGWTSKTRFEDGLRATIDWYVTSRGARP